MPTPFQDAYSPVAPPDVGTNKQIRTVSRILSKQLIDADLYPPGRENRSKEKAHAPEVPLATKTQKEAPMDTTKLADQVAGADKAPEVRSYIIMKLIFLCFY